MSRFGICTTNGSLKEVLEELESAVNVQVVGLHGHFYTRDRSVGSFRKITQGLCEIAREYSLKKLEYIDVGGGIFGEVQNPCSKMFQRSMIMLKRFVQS